MLVIKRNFTGSQPVGCHHMRYFERASRHRMLKRNYFEKDLYGRILVVGGFCEELLETFSIFDTPNARQLQDRLAAGQG